MTIRAIDSSLLELLLFMGQEAHPKEFAAFLIEQDGVLAELTLIPGTIGGTGSATVPLDMIPTGLSVAGSAHSHPNGIIRPSDADISFFSQSGASCHIIVGFPYEPGSYSAFRPDGSVFDLEVTG